MVPFFGGRPDLGVRVILVLELDRQLREPFPRVDIFAGERADGSIGLLDAAAEAVLRKLSSEVSKDRAGLETRANPRDVDDVLRDAGNLLLTAVTWTIEPKRSRGNFFEEINTLSSLRYENAEARGRLIIGSEEGAGPCELAFERRVPLRQATWARKAIQMSTEPFGALCDGESISGIVRRPTDELREFSVRFAGQGRWDLTHGKMRLASVCNGVPSFPFGPLRREDFERRFSRVFPEAELASIDRIWALVGVAMKQSHGTMVVVATDAATEAGRIGQQGTRIEPTYLEPDTLLTATAIDGAILLDVDGSCHAICARRTIVNARIGPS